MPKQVEMFGDQRDIIELLADKAAKGSYITIPSGLEGTLRALVTAFDAAQYDGPQRKALVTPEYQRGYDEGYEQGDRDCMQSWTRSNRQRSGT